MKFFSITTSTATIQEGTFTCPQCSCDQAYKHEKASNFFAVAKMPLLALGKTEEYVQCQCCQEIFTTNLLDEQQKNLAYEQAIKHCFVQMMLVDGMVDKAEVFMVMLFINKFVNNNVSLEEVQQYVTEAQHSTENLQTYFEKVNPSLTASDKESILRCAISVAAADGYIAKSELKMIHEIAVVLEMPATRLNKVLKERLQANSRTLAINLRQVAA